MLELPKKTFYYAKMRLITTWKEIEKFCGKCKRTLKTWDKHIKLPVIKSAPSKSGIVSIEEEELMNWLRQMSKAPRVQKIKKINS